MTSRNRSFTGTRIARKDGNGHWAIGLRLGSGNEGEVYAVQNDPSHAVKVYHESKKPGPDLTQKLRAMENHAPPGPPEAPGLPTLGWPKQLIWTNAQTELVGFIMPRVETQRFLRLGVYCNPETRASSIDRKYNRNEHVAAVVRNAIANLTQTVHRLHQQDSVIGDINDNNVLINYTDGFVSVIDCDSFQYIDPTTNRIYPCTVGRAEYTPPELLKVLDQDCDNPVCPRGGSRHRARYGCVVREKDHDRFAMAVAIFKLLMNGAHPYDCKVDGPTAQRVQTIKDRISAGYYPYSSRRPSHIAPPAQNQLLYGRLPQPIRELFERAFA